MDLWVTPHDLRLYVGTGLNADRYGDALLGSNIRAAQTFLQRETGRQFEVQNATTKTFTSHGQAVVQVPDLRNVTSVTLQDSEQTANETYWLLPDTRHSGVHVAVQLRAYGSDWRSNPQWFDRNLDQPWWRTYGGSLPNDLVITGDWGWTSKDDDLLIGVKALAAWLTKRADAVLSGGVLTPDGNLMDYSRWPIEAQSARTAYMRGQQMVGI